MAQVRVRASGVVVISRGAILGTPNVFRTRRRLSFSFILGDPNFFVVCLLPRVRVINTVTCDDGS